MFVTTDDDAGARKVLHGLGHEFIEAADHGLRSTIGPAAWPRSPTGSRRPA
jgi:hypothetical protein